MKKITKISAIAIAIVLLCLSLSGCASLDLMREEQCFWTNDDNIDSITLSNGEVYLKLDDAVSENIYYTGYEYNFVYVTKKDVPVLLSKEYSIQLELDDSENFIYGYIPEEQGIEMLIPNSLEDDYYFFGGGGGKVMNLLYCKEELYDDIMKQYNKGVEYTHYGYDYHFYTYDEDGMQENTVSSRYDCTKEETAIVDKILKDIKPQSNSDIPYNSTHLCTLYKLSDENLFCKTQYEIYTVDDKYYLAKYSEALDEYNIYEVPSKYDSDFDKITKEAKEAYDEEYYVW